MLNAASSGLPGPDGSTTIWITDGPPPRRLPEEGTMDEFVIMGLVLQEIEYGESDRIIKILKRG